MSKPAFMEKALAGTFHNFNWECICSCLAVGAMITLMSPHPADAAETTVFYKISGKTAGQLIAEMNKKGKEGGWGHTFLEWKASAEPVVIEGKVKASKVTVTQNITFTMPKWTGLDTADDCMKGSWEKMYSSLQNHENEHVKLGKDVAASLEAEILAIEPQDSTKKFSKAVDATTKRVIAENKAVQKKFDEDTAHGSKESLDDPVVLKSCP